MHTALNVERKINGSLIWATDTITREDLIRLKDRAYDAILDLHEWKYFDVDDNSWKDIEGDQ